MEVFGSRVPELRDQLVGWEGFGDMRFIAQMGGVLLSAVVLAVIIGYHPSIRRKASTLEELEQPKTFIMYSIVAALIALIVKVQPSMALVVFGIGGLLRFRTNVGQAKDTGRVILVTVVGLCCGLELYVIAVLATLSGWVLIFALEGHTVGKLVVQGLPREIIASAAAGYTRVLTEAGCSIVGEERYIEKGIATFVYRAPRGVGRKAIESRFDSLPEAERGAVSWDTV
ncbi:MgtC/SapB family protein [Paraliomyxa miuraensis]|uniref:hypothetical protein n=1 Tax=Paraliomyxa miuraensis TaxID=376150 RepID=UPI002258279D|nr:hypothetical protein [Paraliomyxa miuraensis]MCX4245312.1 DUF4956 domain-containing protein [Paraliomyxa miuraensis]